MSLDQPSQSNASHSFLRRADQAAVAGLCLFAIVALAIYWIAQGGLTGRLIEIDHADQVTANFKVDVNTADWTELTTLPEVGQTMAERIVEYRKRYGPFREVDDLRQVRGIGPKTLERLKPYLLPLGASPSTANTQQQKAQVSESTDDVTEDSAKTSDSQ